MAKIDESVILSPRENPHLFGHEDAEQRFVDEITRGVMHHAYLITGAKGIGKATLAYRLARHMLGIGSRESGIKEASLFGDAFAAPIPNSQSPLYLAPEDPLFRRVAAGSHSDLLILSPSVDIKKGTERAEITAEEARAVPEFMSLTPAEGDWRIVIVDSVDQLNTHAANALLKILEEPPEKAILFLVCHQPGGVLPTIRSRCRHFKLNPPDWDAFEKILATVAPSVDRADYSALYALSFGSPGYAITLHAHKGLELYEAWLRAMLPTATPQSRIGFAEKVAAMKNPLAFDLVLHGWRTALYRISLAASLNNSLFHDERDCLATLAAHYSAKQCHRWREVGEAMIAATDTFNLEKKTAIRLLLEPERLDSLMAA